MSTGALTIKLYDLASNLLADISSICFDKTYEPEFNGARKFTVTGPAGHSLFTTVAGDGYPHLWEGNRKVIVWEDYAPTQPLIHARIQTVEWNGDGKENLVTFVALSPIMELGYESDDRAGRPVRDSTGNFISPTFTSSVGGQTAVSGPDLIKQILTNSQNTDPTLGEGPLPIALTGTFDLTVPPAVDLRCGDKMDWPVLCGDFIQDIVKTGVVDLVERPVDPTEGLDPYIMVELSAVSAAGTDKSATVHFHYWTGSYNASAARLVHDFSTVNNKPFYYLGPRIDQTHWRANIAPDSPGVTPDPTASRALYGGPGVSKGQFMSIQVFDTIGDESTTRPLYLAEYNAELGYRLFPRYELWVTPNMAAKAVYDAPRDFDIGDQVGIKTGAPFGVALDQKQRVYGYSASWDRQNVKRLSQLKTSADVSL